MTSSTRPWSHASTFVAFLLFLYILSAPLLQHVTKYESLTPHSNEPSSFRSENKNPWADLSKDEADELVDFLFSRTDLNLTRESEATSLDNTLTLVEVLQPNKTDALAYLNGTAGLPQRWARVLVNQVVHEVAYMKNYMVGPLPITNATVILPLEYCYNSGKNFVANPVPSIVELHLWGMGIGTNLSDITLELLDGQVGALDPDSLEVVARIAHIEHAVAVYWIQFFRQGKRSGAESILPQGLYFKLETRSRDPATWKIGEWYYNGVIYDSASSLRTAMKSPGFQKTSINFDGEWTDTVDFGEGPSGRELPAPAMVQPNGARYKIDKQEKYVSWMGFNFYMGTYADTGVALYDIKFNGDNVIHEIGLQEAMSHYAGDDPSQGGQEFLDTFYGMGLSMFELVPGYDCPTYADFLSSTFRVGEKSVTNKNSICIFEYTSDAPLQRHTTGSQVSVSKNTYLVVRFVSTVWNYDYTFDYIFYLDGTIEVKVRASGFIFGAFWTANSTKNEDEYGYRVHDAVASSMHDHVINFKADLDVAGTANTFVRVGIEPVTLEFPWDDETTTPRNTMHLVPHIVKEEAGLDWPGNSGQIYVVMNANSTNAWGERRGYRIVPGTGVGTPSHLSILNSTTLGKSAEWASQDLWLLRRKDTEPKSASPLNCLDPDDPMIDFGKFVDGENVVQEDLVVYFNLGQHHVPHAGDIPNTLMHTSASSVMFVPFNFHDRDPSRRSANGVKIGLDAEGARPEYFGGRYTEGVELEAEDLEPDMKKYGGEQCGMNLMGWNHVMVAA